MDIEEKIAAPEQAPLDLLSCQWTFPLRCVVSLHETKLGLLGCGVPFESEQLRVLVAGWLDLRNHSKLDKRNLIICKTGRCTLPLDSVKYYDPADPYAIYELKRQFFSAMQALTGLDTPVSQRRARLQSLLAVILAKVYEFAKYFLDVDRADERARYMNELRQASVGVRDEALETLKTNSLIVLTRIEEASKWRESMKHNWFTQQGLFLDLWEKNINKYIV
jgi:hypothetical protein